MKALWPGQSAWNWKSVDSFYLILPHPIKERALGKKNLARVEDGALIKFLEKIFARQNLLDQDDVLAWQLIARRNELRCSSTCDEQREKLRGASGGTS